MGPMQTMFKYLMEHGPIYLDDGESSIAPEQINEVDYRNPVANAFAPSPGVGPRAYRDPMQGGPSPPTGDGTFAQLARGRR